MIFKETHVYTSLSLNSLVSTYREVLSRDFGATFLEVNFAGEAAVKVLPKSKALENFRDLWI